MDPVSALEGGGYWIGAIYPTTHFLTIASGTFSKALVSPTSPAPSCRCCARDPGAHAAVGAAAEEAGR